MRGEFVHEAPLLRVEPGVVDVALAREAGAVVARDVRDDGDLVGREPFEVGVFDDVERVLVVAAAADGVPHIAEDGGVFEQLTLVLAPAVERRRRVEEAEGEAGDVARVLLVPPEPDGEVVDAPPPHAAERREPLDPLVVPLDEVDHDPLAERVGADLEPLDPEVLQHHVDERGAGDDLVHALLQDAGHRRAAAPGRSASRASSRAGC